ncbi:DUF3718 domain-containing protein [Glaciecola siphonariae]|uniref:DUF3718 domain-containing protein n=1 Tax=Glaciecola siphonariae TaxID=521012 RepID=A0ABV9LTA6_9ALTE
MKKLLVLTTLTLGLSAAAGVSNASDFAKTNDNFETQICYAAATEGLSGAEALVQSKGLSFRTFKKSVNCNGLSLAAFAKQYAKRNANDKDKVKLELVATNNDVESKICIEALTRGMDKTVAKYKINKDYIRCNGKPLPRFVNESKRRGQAVVSVSN